MYKLLFWDRIRLMKKLRLLIIAFMFAGLFISCMSIKEIPLEKTSAQIIQMGQDASTSGYYKSAIFCFNTAIDRYGTDPNVFAEAKYELAHIFIKQKKYEEAYDIIMELQNIYDYYPTVLPPAYKKLANIALSKIPDKKLSEIQKKKALEATVVEDETIKLETNNQNRGMNISEEETSEYDEAEDESYEEDEDTIEE